jgi:hypothetical protein
MYKRSNKSQLCAQNCHNFKIQSLDLAKSDVCVTVNVCTVYDQTQIAQYLAVSLERLLYYTSLNTHSQTLTTVHV